MPTMNEVVKKAPTIHNLTTKKLAVRFEGKNLLITHEVEYLQTTKSKPIEIFTDKEI